MASNHPDLFIYEGQDIGEADNQRVMGGQDLIQSQSNLP